MQYTHLDQRSSPRRRRHRLSETPTGVPVLIANADSLKIAHRLVVLGLSDGAKVIVESRGRNGDIILVSEDDRFHLQGRHADRIWVDPIQ